MNGTLLLINHACLMAAFVLIVAFAAIYLCTARWHRNPVGWYIAIDACVWIVFLAAYIAQIWWQPDTAARTVIVTVETVALAAAICGFSFALRVLLRDRYAAARHGDDLRHSSDRPGS